MRKITKKEAKKAGRIFAGIFSEYDLYDLIFKKDEKQEKRISYFFTYEVYSSLNSTYEFDDFKALATVIKPGERETNPLKLFLNPLYALKFLFSTGLKSIRIGKEYMEFAENTSAEYYNPSTDCYIKNIGVIKECRGQGYLKRMIDEICGDMPVILETHLDTNVRIYEKLGFKVLNVKDFHGKKHYVMKRF